MKKVFVVLAVVAVFLALYLPTLPDFNSVDYIVNLVEWGEVNQPPAITWTDNFWLDAGNTLKYPIDFGIYLWSFLTDGLQINPFVR